MVLDQLVSGPFFCNVIDLISAFISHKIVVTPLSFSPSFSFISYLLFSFIEVTTSSSLPFYVSNKMSCVKKNKNKLKLLMVADVKCQRQKCVESRVFSSTVVLHNTPSGDQDPVPVHRLSLHRSPTPTFCA